MVDKKMFIAGVFAIIISGVGGYVQVNNRLSKVETKVEYLQGAQSKIDNLNTKVEVLIEQNKWIQSKIEEIKEDSSDLYKTKE